MSSFVHVPSTVSYRVLLVDPGSFEAFALREPTRESLPMVRVPKHSRHAHELRVLFRTQWHLATFVAGFVHDSIHETNYAIVELLGTHRCAKLTAISLERLLEEQFSGVVRDVIHAYLKGSSADPMFRLGWIDDAIRWIESMTTCTITDKTLIEQVQVGPGFCLMKVPLDNGRSCWFKAIGHPNKHETDITRFLTEASRPTAPFLPRLLGFHERWNALLMDHGGVPLSNLSVNSIVPHRVLKDAVRSLALFQKASIELVAPLQRLGAMHQSLARISEDADSLCDFLALAMSHQTSRRVPPLSHQRLREIMSTVQDTCACLERLELPPCIVHGDLNAGNILAGTPCLFIDWCETYIGHPLVCLQHVLLLDRLNDPREQGPTRSELIATYRDVWSEVVERWRLDAAIPHMPLIAAVSALYGRGDGVHTAERHSSTRLAYARTLARHMDRAARTLKQEVA